MLTVVLGAPFAAKRWWIRREIEKREEAGEIGLLALDFTAIYTAMTPGDQSAYRDQRVTDSGAARLAAYVLQAAVKRAVEVEADGYVAVDSPRRALATVEQVGAREVVEVEVSEAAALRRSEQHVELVSELAPRAAADDAKAAAAQCRQMVRAYFRERPMLDAVNVRKVRAPSAPPPDAIAYAYRAAVKARRRGDSAKVRQWMTAARDWSAAHGLPTAGIRVPE